MNLVEITEGTDFTDLLKIVKYEPPEVGVSTGGETKGYFPGFIQKTDEERVENFNNIESLLAAHEWDVTVKCDGTSGTFYFNGEFGACSRNLELKDTEENIFWKMARKYDLEQRLKTYGKHYAIQGEVVGPGIQSNRLGITEVRLLVFTIQDIDTFRRLTTSEMLSVIADLNAIGNGTAIEIVPILKNVPELKTFSDVATLSEGNCILTERTREGIVLRAKDDASVSMKFINPKYLLKHDL